VLLSLVILSETKNLIRQEEILHSVQDDKKKSKITFDTAPLNFIEKYYYRIRKRLLSNFFMLFSAYFILFTFGLAR
jgi:hypothetical protein